MNVSSSAMRLEVNPAASTTTRGPASSAGWFGGSGNVLLHNQLLTQRRAIKVVTLKCSSAAKPVDSVIDKQKEVSESTGLSRIESLSQVSGVLGSQWGDEGKGKLVDILAKHFNVVAGCQDSM